MSWVLFAAGCLALLVLFCAQATSQCEEIVDISYEDTSCDVKARPILLQKQWRYLPKRNSTSVYDSEGGLVEHDHENLSMISFNNEATGSSSMHRPDPEGSPKQFRFSPVSVTLRCIMSNTVLMMAAYTSLAVLRNSVELMNVGKPPPLAEALEVSVRAAGHASILCVLFVACRMYVLASSKGKDDPPVWIRVCMVVASVGLFLQVMLGLAVPNLFVEREDASLPNRAGHDCCGHIRLSKEEFKDTSQWYVACAWQAVAALCIYGGAAAVITGIFSLHNPFAISPAVVSVVLLVCLFLLNQAHIALSALCSPDGRVPRPLRDAAQRARKAPMIGVFFLAVRMRNLQVDPPDGMPPRWVWMSYYLVVLGVMLEMIASAFGPADEAQQDKREVVNRADHEHFSEFKWVRIAQQVSACLVFASLFSVFLSVLISMTEAGELSTAMKAVMMLSSLFFSVHILQWLASFFESAGDVFNVIQETALAAGVCVNLCPLLSILFVACRMRALQLTSQKGSPQWWAQECIWLGVIAIFIQVSCCLILPLFTGAASSVDADGNPEYNLKPLFGAYVVQVLKYMALIGLYGSVLAVCSSIVLMDGSVVKDEGVWHIGSLVGSHLIVGCMAFVLAGLLSSAKVVGFIVKWAIEGLDERLLGVNITVGKAALSLCRGYVFVNNLVVENPPNAAYISKRLLKIGHVVLKVNLWRLVASRGKEIEINTLILKGVEVNYEKDLFGDSNVGAVVQFLKGPQDEGATDGNATKADQPAETPSAPAAQKQGSEKTLSAPAVQKSDSDNANSDSPEIELRTLEVKDIAANVWIKQSGQIVLSVNLANFEEPDFQEHFQGKKHVLIQDILGMVLRTLLNTVIANSARLGSALGSGAATAVQAAASRTFQKAEGGFAAIYNCLPCCRVFRRPQQPEISQPSAESVLQGAR